MTDPFVVTVTPPFPPFALIAAPNWPVAYTLFAVTCTGPVVVAGGCPLFALRNLPLSARIPTASEPSAVIGPEAFTVTAPAIAASAAVVPPLAAAMPMPPPP
jgi:hypothetical protein